MQRPASHDPRVRAAVLDVITSTKGDLRSDEANFIAQLRAAVAGATTPVSEMLDKYRTDRQDPHGRVFAAYKD